MGTFVVNHQVIDIIIAIEKIQQSIMDNMSKKDDDTVMINRHELIGFYQHILNHRNWIRSKWSSRQYAYNTNILVLNWPATNGEHIAIRKIKRKEADVVVVVGQF